MGGSFDSMPRRCSVCGKAAIEQFKPFCSPRCANVDLGRWLGEGYRVKGDESDPDGLALPPEIDNEGHN